MKKKKVKKVTKDIEVVESILCNRCGKEYVNKDWVGRLHEFSIDFAHYYSRFDCQKWNFDLCEECVLEVVNSFKYMPDGFQMEIPYSKEVQNSMDKGEVLNDDIKEEDRLKQDDSFLFAVLNDLDIMDIRGGEEIDYVLVEQTKQFCLLLSKIKPDEWEKYLENYADGEYVDIAPLAWELGANAFDNVNGFHIKGK